MATRRTHPPSIVSEVWLCEWFEFGFIELTRYLAKHAAFAAWLDTHPKEEHSDQ